MDGMNEKGLAVGYHFVNRLKPGDGFICCSIARMLLDTCKSTEEAIWLLKEIPHRHAFNYSLYDSSGHAAIAEASSKGVQVKRGQKLACTNHFELGDKRSENRNRLEETMQRKKWIEGRFHTELNPKDAFAFSTGQMVPYSKKSTATGLELFIQLYMYLKHSKSL